MAKIGTKIVASPSRVAKYLQDVAIYGGIRNPRFPHSIVTWFNSDLRSELDAVGKAAFNATFDDLTQTLSSSAPDKSAIYDFIAEKDENVKRMYFLMLAEYGLAKFTRNSFVEDTQ